MTPPSDSFSASAPGRPRAFAVVGDVHGAMHAMVGQVEAASRRLGVTPEFVLQVGDFEPHRDEADLASMSSPRKYRRLGDFADYHSGRARFPWPVYFIGGNHEPYGFLDRLGSGPVAPNCAFLGRVGRVELGGLRVVGLSGIEKPRLLAGRPSLDAPGARTKDLVGFSSAEVSQACAAGPADLLLLHDWPAGAVDPLDAALFAAGHRAGAPEAVGNDSARAVVDALRPDWVFCGHMHRGYRSTIAHPQGQPTQLAGLAKVGSPGAVGLFSAEGGRVRELVQPPEPAESRRGPRR